MSARSPHARSTHARSPHEPGTDPGETMTRRHATQRPGTEVDA
ncbi:hypothetical protein BKA22_002285 [Cellulomonas soli]|nr:hypothetical protein [Cellulomonas soli]